MNWENLLNAKRFGEKENTTISDLRSQFQRDYDRLIFSPEFRKLQSKTQVFPLPGDIFVHNRLTHSLEVSCVGRSIARLIIDFLCQQHGVPVALANEIPTIVSTACLAHDIGNPPFGHSGEAAISSYFIEKQGKDLSSSFTEQEWLDLTHFEGNANLLRLLVHQFNGRREGGFALTVSTLASMIKYPYSSLTNAAKYGYFSSEEKAFKHIVSSCGLDSGDKIIRHPLVYLVEAADDISYLIMDIEDAHRLGILSTATILEYFLPFIELHPEISSRYKKQSKGLSEPENVAYLRSLVIHILSSASAQVFIENYDAIMRGDFQQSVASMLPPQIKPLLDRCKKLGKEVIYCDQGVRKLEISGHKILTTLLNEYVEAIFAPEKRYSKLIIQTIPAQFLPHESAYNNVRLIIDYLSSMTDSQALKLFHELTGIDIPQRREL